VQGDARRFGFCSSAGEARLERTSSCFWPVRQTSVAGFGIGDTREVRPKTHVFPQSVAKSNEIDRRLRIGLGNSGDMNSYSKPPGARYVLRLELFEYLHI
jgi:hypothetical protein